MRRVFVATAGVAMMLLAGIQLVPVKAGVNPPLNRQHAIEAALDVTPAAQAVFGKACRNCHSYETEWPWYSRIAPISWMVSHDVERARNAMNLSEWPRSRAQAGKLMAACAGLEAGRMPPAPYRMMHPEAKLTKDEIRAFCAWTTATARDLRATRRPTNPTK